MKVENFGCGDSRNDRIVAVWGWIYALDAFDHNDPEPLKLLIAGTDPIPEELRPALASIVAGDRKPNKRAAAALKVPASERMKIAGTLSGVLSLIDVFKYGETWDWDTRENTGRLLEAIADKHASEVKSELRKLEAEATKLIADTAASLGVSIETVENLLRDARKKIENYPNV